MADHGRQDRCFVYGSAEELGSDLVNAKSYSKKVAVLKRIIANATMGNDMSALCTSVAECMSLQDIHIKKMGYFFLSNYGMRKKEALTPYIDLFTQDAKSQDAITRASALRTMASLLTDDMVHGLLDPVRSALYDKKPYVRKTAAMCVARMYMYDAALMEKSGFIEKLFGMMYDTSTDVVVSAVAALYHMAESSHTMQLSVNFKQANHLVQVMHQCSEWGQTYIMETLLFFTPQTGQEAHMLADALSRHVQVHSPTLALTASKVAMFLMNYMSDMERMNALGRWIGYVLMPHMKAPPEILYTILTNVLLYLQRRPMVLRLELSPFLCTYSDPEYIKLVKLDILYQLATQSNATDVLDELQSCVTDINENIARKATHMIGRLALKWSLVADPCVAALKTIMQGRADYALQESVMVVKDILRKYPDRYGYIVTMLCDHIPSLYESPAKVSMIWILGHFCDRVEGSTDALHDYTLSFLDESSDVQLALLTATVKLFLRKPKSGGPIVQKILHQATDLVANPDVRDRGYFYMRLLTLDASMAMAVAFADASSEEALEQIQQHVLDQLILHGASLVPLLQQNPPVMIPKVRHRFMPDSPALEPSARPHASTHMHAEPSQYHTMHDTDDEAVYTDLAPPQPSDCASVAVGQLI